MTLSVRTIKKSVLTSVFWAVLAGSCLVIATGLAPQMAQAQLFDDDKDDPTLKPTNDTVWDAKKLQKLDRNVRKLERALARVENKNEPPILIEPDPEVVALQATVSRMSLKLDDNGQAIIQLTGQLEEANHKLSLMAQSQAEAQSRLLSLSQRLEMAEARIKDISAAIAPPPPPPASTGRAESDFAAAFTLLSAGQYDEAGRAFEGFIQTWPEASQLPEAWFRLGVIRRAQRDTQGSVVALATSLKGWPKNAWAPEANVRLAAALIESNRPNDACSALVEFTKRYASLAATDMKIEAKSLKAKAKCA